jgi:hypothetical protein
MTFVAVGDQNRSYIFLKELDCLRAEPWFLGESRFGSNDNTQQASEDDDERWPHWASNSVADVSQCLMM